MPGSDVPTPPDEVANDLSSVVGALVAAVLVRQLSVLGAVARSARFLRNQLAELDAAGATAYAPVFFIVVPVLREATLIDESVAHFQRLARDHAATLVVVTTERENAEAHRHAGQANTVARVQELAKTGGFVHLHYPDVTGVKADQLNFAARHCASVLPPDVPRSRAFLVCYDADSRPPRCSLSDFRRAIAAWPESEVFHQSSGFELRAPGPRSGRRLGGWLSWAVCDGGALRANRFVLGFELPRLINRTRMVGRVKRRVCSYVYAHVTTHGLCVRLPLVLNIPFPVRSPLEDMHYSFYLGSRDMPMVPVRSLDRAEVPGSVWAQVRQAARWFYGPGRFLQYLKDPMTIRGWRARVQAASAFGSALEWLGCALIPPLTVAVALFAHGYVRIMAGAVIGVYAAQLLLTDWVLGSPTTAPGRLVRLLGCPIATMLFGFGGFLGAGRLLSGGSGIGKTERGGSG